MDGVGGEGIVAFVQGVRNRGLTVTVMSRKHLPSGLKFLPLSKSSVETSTDVARHNLNNSAQICDGRYASSYQLAHCRLIPTSPTAMLAEFPPQRLEPSRTNGNFEVGRLARRETANTPTQTFRGEMVRHSRSVYSTCPSPLLKSPSLPSDAFIDSLRKYPFSPDRSMSSELVQRLLIYTQAKHLSRNSSRSMRSLREKGSHQSRDAKRERETRNVRVVRDTRDKKTATSANKDVQTYMRVVNETNQRDEVTRIRRGCKPSYGSSSRLKLDQLCETYNYLNASCNERPSNIGRGSEVRYLNDVKRCIRQAIRGMVDSTPVVCPNIQSRYSQHRKTHHSLQSVGTIQSQDMKTDQQQSTSETECSRLKSCISRHSKQNPQQFNRSSECPDAKDWVNRQRQHLNICDPASSSDMAVQECPNVERCHRQHIKAHHQQEPYNAGSDQGLKLQGEPSTSKHDPGVIGCMPPRPPRQPCGHRPPCHCKTRSITSQEGRISQTEDQIDIEKDILQWLNGLPVYVNDTQDNKSKRLKMVKQLANELNNIMDKDDYNERAKEEIKRFIDRLPIWYPEDKEEKKLFKSHITDSLFEKVHRYRDLKEVVTDWLNDINFIGVDSRGRAKNKIVEQFVDQLEPIIYTTKDKLKKEILKMIPNVFERIKKNKHMKHSMDDIANKLVDKIDKFLSQDNKRTRYRSDSKFKMPVFEQYVWSWLAHNTYISENMHKINQELVKSFCRKLNDLQFESADDDNVENEIRDFLDKLDGIQINSKDKDYLVKSLLRDIKSEHSAQKRKKSTINYPSGNAVKQPISEQSIWDWLEKAISVPEEIKRKIKTLVKNFSQKLNYLQTHNADDCVMEEEINTFLDTLSEKGLQINPKEKDKLVKSLLNDIQSKYTSRKRKTSEYHEDSDLERSTWDFLENAVNIPEVTRKRNQGLINSFSQKLKDLSSNDADDDVIEKEIRAFLDLLAEKGIILNSEDKSELLRNILNDLKSKPKPQNPITEKSIWDQLENATDYLPVHIKRQNQKLMTNFTQKLKDLREEDADDELIKDEIEDFLDMLSDRGIQINPKDKNTLVKSLLEDIKSTPKSQASITDKSKWDWLDSTTDVPEDTKRKSKELMKKFTKKLTDLREENADDEVIKDVIQDFFDTLPERGIQINSNAKRKLIRSLLEDIKSAPRAQEPITEKSRRDRLKSATDVPEEIKRKNKELKKKVTQKLKELREENVDDEVVKEETRDFLDSLPETGIQSNSKAKNKLARNLLSDVRSKSLKPQILITEKSIWDQLENATNVLEDIKRKNKKVMKNFAQKLKDLQEEDADDEAIKDEIRDFLDTLPERGIQINPKDKNKLINNLLDDFNSKFISQQQQQLQEPTPEQSFRDKLESAANMPESTKSKNQGLIKNFSQKPKDLQVENDDKEVVKEEIKNFLDKMPQKRIQINSKANEKPVKRFLNDVSNQKQNKNTSPDKDGSHPLRKTALSYPLSEQSTWDWLKSATDVPEYTKKINQDIIKNFSKKINDLLSENADDDVIEEEIRNFLDVLPERRIRIDPGDKNKLVEKLLNDIKLETRRPKRNKNTTYHPDDSRSEELISEESVWNWLEKAVNVPEEIKKKNQKLVHGFIKKIRDLQSKNAKGIVIEGEIREFLDILTRKGIQIDPESREKLVKMLTSNLKSSPRPRKRITSLTIYPDPDESGFIQPISHRSNWVVKNARHVSEDVKKKNQDLIQSFHEKVKDLQYANVNEDVIEKELRYFLNSLPKKGIHVIHNDPEILVRNILDDLRSQPKSRKRWEQSNQNRNAESLIKDEISEIIDDIPTTIETIKRQIIKDKIAEVLVPILHTLSDNDAIKHEIVDILKEAKLPQREAYDLANALINRVKGMPLSDSTNIITEPEIRDIVIDEVTQVLDKFSVPASDRDTIEQSIIDILTDKILSGTNDSQTGSQIFRMLRKANVSKADAREISARLIEKGDEISLAYKAQDSATLLSNSAGSIHLSSLQRQALEKCIENEILDFMEDVTGDDDIEIRNIRKNATGLLAHKLASIMSHPNQKNKDARIKVELSRYLNESSIPTEELKEELTKQLKNQVQDIGLKTSTPYKKTRKSEINYVAADSGPKSKRKPKFLDDSSSSGDETQKDLFFVPKDYSVDNTSFESNDVDVSTSKRKPMPEHLQHDKFDDTVSKPKQFPKHKEQNDFKNSVPKPQTLLKYSEIQMANSMSSPKSAIKRKSYESIDDLVSIPKKGLQRYAQNKDQTDDAESVLKTNSEILYDGEKYIYKLVNTIKSWIDDVGISTDSTFDSEFKETMANDLAGDILDRQKYIQENSDAVTSNKDELEHLKNQIHKWLHKFLDMEDLTPMEPDIKSLMKKILSNQVPQLIPLLLKTTKMSHKNETQNDMKEIKDIISQWMKEIHPSILSAADKSILNNKIPKLAKDIHEMCLNNEIGNTENVHNIISKWIKPLNIEQDELLRIADDLKTLLLQKGLTEPSGIVQDTSEFVEENLKGAILDWLKTLPLYQRRNSYDKRTQESLVDDLANGIKSVFDHDSVSDGDTDKKLIKEIKKYLRRFPMEPELQSDERFIQTLAEHLLDYLKHLQLFQDISVRESENIPLKDDISKHVDEWTDNLPLPKIDSSNKVQLENLKAKLSSRIRELIHTGPNNEFKLTREIQNSLKAFPIENNVKENQSVLNELAEQLMNKLKAARAVDTPIMMDNIKGAVSQWIEKLKLPKSDEPYIKDIINKAEHDLNADLANLLIDTDMVPLKTVKANIQKAVCQFLEKIPVNPYRVQDIKPLADSLFNIIKEYSKYSTRPVIKKAADVMLDVIREWSENLPIKAETPENKDKAKKLKEQIENKLIHKIGEINMNPEVFNNDYFYENMLEDEIDEIYMNTLNECNINESLLDCLKKDLINKVKAARQFMREENAGQIYKQQLLDAISKSTPVELSEDEKASFDVLKDSVADAFISMHYVGGDEEEKNKLRKKVVDEINKFSNSYLKNHPASPIDTQKLNKNLYQALKTVLEPNNESLRNEVELVKIKEKVKNWATELPLYEQNGKEKLKTNQMLSVLAKKIHDIEKEKELFPDMNYDTRMKREIIKLMKKLPLSNQKEEDINQCADKLIKSLKESKESRRANASHRFSIEPDTECFCYVPMVQPCTLTLEDRMHLQTIRERTPRQKVTTASVLFKDVSVSPIPVDACSQTIIFKNPGTCASPMPIGGLAQQSSSVQTPPQRMQAVGSQVDISPHVLVKEYYWDSVDTELKSTITCVPSPRQFSCRSQRTIIPQDSRHTTTTAPRPCMASGSPCSPQPSQGQSYVTPQSSVPFRSHEQNLSQSQKNPPGCRYLPSPSHFPSRNAPRPPPERRNISEASQYPTPYQISCPRNKPEQFQTPMSQQGSQYANPMSERASQYTTPFSRHCMDPTAPCMPHTQSSSYETPQGMPQADPSGSQYRITFSPNRKPPCHKSQEAPPVSSADDDEAHPSWSSFRKPRVTRLGSLDHMEPRACSSRHFDWGKFPEDFKFYDRNRRRRCMVSDDDFDEMYINETEENVRCKCKERLMTKCKGKRRGYTSRGCSEPMKSCSKCCGMHCSHPNHNNMFIRH